MRVGSTRMTELVPYPSTQTLPPPIATPHGPTPTSTEPVTALVAGSMRTSSPAPPTPTQTLPRPPVSEQGPSPVSMRATTCALPEAPSAATTITPATRMLLLKATIRLIRTPFPALDGKQARDVIGHC